MGQKEVKMSRPTDSKPMFYPLRRGSFYPAENKAKTYAAILREKSSQTNRNLSHVEPKFNAWDLS